MKLRDLFSRRALLERALWSPLFFRQWAPKAWLEVASADLQASGTALGRTGPSGRGTPALGVPGGALPPSLVIDVRAAPYGAVGDGVTDDGLALQRALDEFARATIKGTPVALVLPPGIYRTSRMLRCTAARGGQIRGAGEEQTIIQYDRRGGACEAILQLVNCWYVTCESMTLRGVGTAGAAAAWQSLADAAQPGFAPTNNRCVRVTADQCPFGFSTTAASLFTPVATTSGRGRTPIVVTTAAPHGLSTGSVAGVFGVRGNTAANTSGAVTVMGPNRFTLPGTGTGDYSGGGIVVWTYGEGGPGTNRSDQNNDNMKFDQCTVLHAEEAAVVIGGENSLAHQFVACDLAGPIGVWLPAGGSFAMFAGSISARAWDFVVAGRMEHPCTVYGTYTESASGFLYADPDLPPDLRARWINFKAFGFDKKGGPTANRSKIAGLRKVDDGVLVVTTEAPHDLRTGQLVAIGGVRGSAAANGEHAVRVLTPTSFSVRADGGVYEGGGEVAAAARLIDLNGVQCQVSLTSCSLCTGVSSGAMAIHCRDMNGGGPASRIMLVDCEIGPDEFVLDSFVLVDEHSRWGPSHDGRPRETLLNGAEIVQFSAGGPFSPVNNQYKLGNLRGIRGIGGVGAKPGVNLANVAVLQGSRAGTNTSLHVAFPGGPEIDTNYAIVATPTTVIGSPAPNSWRIRSIEKGKAGFAITTEADPGMSGDVPNSVTFDWHLIRWG